MARAGSICIEDGCPEFAVAAGRCKEHEPDHGWDSSTRRKPVGWARTRKRILFRDKRRCVLCGSKAGLTVDHLRAQAFGGGEQHSNLRTLCKRCHASKTADEASTGRAIAGQPRTAREQEIKALIYRWS